jgi:chromate transporter
MGLITPGPVVITATFIGYLVDGFRGAAVATVAIFLPIYLGVVIPGRWFIRHRESPRLQGFAMGATAAAAGAIGGATIVLARGAIFDLATAVIAVVGLALLLLKVPEPVLVVMAGAAGLLLTTL